MELVPKGVDQFKDSFYDIDGLLHSITHVAYITNKLIDIILSLKDLTNINIHHYKLFSKIAYASTYWSLFLDFLQFSSKIGKMFITLLTLFMVNFSCLLERCSDTTCHRMTLATSLSRVPLSLSSTKSGLL